MATVSITIPNALVPRVVAMMRARFPDHAGDTDAAAFRAITAEYWRDLLVNYEAGLAVPDQSQILAQIKQARDAAELDAQQIT